MTFVKFIKCHFWLIVTFLKNDAEKAHNYCTSSPWEREGDYPTRLQPTTHKLHCNSEEHHLCTEKRLTWRCHFPLRHCSERCCKWSILGITKENPFENTVEANTCHCNWLLLLQDPGAASILALLCITETQNTFSQKDSFTNHVRWAVNYGSFMVAHETPEIWSVMTLVSRAPPLRPPVVMVIQ